MIPSNVRLAGQSTVMAVDISRCFGMMVPGVPIVHRSKSKQAPPPACASSRSRARLSGVKLTDSAIQAFAELWRKEFDEVLSFDEARVKASAFLELCWSLIQPLPGEPDYSGPPIAKPLT